jgi:hypothetical protein
MALIAAHLIGGARNDKPIRPKKQKPARKSTSKKKSRKPAKQRKAGFKGVNGDDDLLEMLFDTARDKRN